MRQSIALLLTSSLTAIAVQLISPSASASIEACGNIDVSAEAECELLVEGGCVAECTPVNFQASCSAELYVGCEGQCSGSASVDCRASCDADCQAQCTVKPGEFDCSAGCEVNCSGRCDAYCGASANKAECRASCESTCSGECGAECSGTPPEASCDAKCEASCSGSCEAQANFDCQVQCQSKGFAECEAELQGGCEAQCTQPEGALFCNGQYIDARDQLQECLAYLEGVLQIDVEGYANADAECRGNTCRADAEAGVSCMASPAGAPMDARGLVVAAAGLGLLVARRRRHG